MRAAHLDPPFGEDGSSYVSMDDEMIGCGQVFSRDVNCDEADRPFSKVFLINSATVFTLMEKAFGKTSFWTNARQYSKKKEGRKAWLALIKFHFGNDRAVTIAETLRTKLQNSVFAGGPKRNFDFTKFCNLHTGAHTSASDMLMYQEDKTPIFSENQKIQLFQHSITDPYFNMIKGLVNSQRYKYDTFEKVKEAYLNYMRTSPRPDHVRDPANDSRHILRLGPVGTVGSARRGPARPKAPPRTQVKKKLMLVPTSSLRSTPRRRMRSLPLRRRRGIISLRRKVGITTIKSARLPKLAPAMTALRRRLVLILPILPSYAKRQGKIPKPEK